MTQPLDYENWKKTYAASIVSAKRLAELKAFYPNVIFHEEITHYLEREYQRYLENFRKTNNGA
jgi:hypothetical protein